MKKLFALILMLAACFAHAGPNDPYDWRDVTNNSIGNGIITYYTAWPAANADCVRYGYGALKQPGCATLGSNVTITAGVINAADGDWNATVGNPGYIANKPTMFDGAWSSLSGRPTTLSAAGITDGVTSSALSTALASKFNNPTGNTAQYLLGDGSLATMPTVPTINRARITTASDGTYTWTYPTACGAGQVPVVQITAEGSASISYNSVITAAPTNTQVSIKITQVADIVILSTIHVLGVQSPSATVVHLTAICP